MFSKATALAVIDSNLSPAGNAKLGDEQLATIYKISDITSYRYKYGSALPFVPVIGANGQVLFNQGSLTVLRDGGSGEFGTKTKAEFGGAQDGYGSLDNAEVQEITITADESLAKVTPIGAIDEITLSNSLAVSALVSTINLMQDNIDYNFFKGLGDTLAISPKSGSEAKQDGNDKKYVIGATMSGINIGAAFLSGIDEGDVLAGKIVESDAKIFAQKLISQAGLLMKLKRSPTLIDNTADRKVLLPNTTPVSTNVIGRYGGTGVTSINKNDVFIDVDSVIFGILTQVAGFTLHDAVMVESGQFQSGSFGGFTIRENPNMEKAYTSDAYSTAKTKICAFISTSKAAVSHFRIVATNIKQPGASDDATVYVEYKHFKDGAKVIFDTTIAGYYGKK